MEMPSVERFGWDGGGLWRAYATSEFDVSYINTHMSTSTHTCQHQHQYKTQTQLDERARTFLPACRERRSVVFPTFSVPTHINFTVVNCCD